ncbi:phosphate acyltransferase, partial [Gluconobacter japonicus]
AVFVGLNGIVVKSHGGADGESFASAIDVAMDAVTHNLNDKIRARLDQLGMLGADTDATPANAVAPEPVS